MPSALKEISIAHSPDSDDAFMYYGLATKNVDTFGLNVVQVMKDIQTLNLTAKQGLYEVSAISFGAYPELEELYALLPCGSSMGLGYGPMVVAREKVSLADLKRLKIAIPGRQTSAYLALRLVEPELEVIEYPFQQIMDAVKDAEVDAGLIIHEGQITYQQLGLHKIVDLGAWWHEASGGLALPLGANAVRKDIGAELMKKAATIFQNSILYALSHRDEALAYAMQFARDLSKDEVDRFVKMYVNDLSVDCGELGRESVRKFFQMAYEKGLIDKEIRPDFVLS